MIFKLFRAYKTGKIIYSKILKPVYEELKRDAYSTENKRTRNRKPKKKDAVNKKSERSRKRQTNS